MTIQRRRKWARYVLIGFCDLARLVWMARRNGMQCIGAYKPDMHVYNEIALYGTPEQMRATERDWRNASPDKHGQHEVLHRKPKAAFGISLNLPRDRWIEEKLSPVTEEPQGTTWGEELRPND